MYKYYTKKKIINHIQRKDIKGPNNKSKHKHGAGTEFVSIKHRQKKEYLSDTWTASNSWRDNWNLKTSKELRTIQSDTLLKVSTFKIYFQKDVVNFSSVSGSFRLYNPNVPQCRWITKCTAKWFPLVISVYLCALWNTSLQTTCKPRQANTGKSVW